MDDLGRNSTRTLATGTVASYFYDPVGRPSGTEYMDGSRTTLQFDPVSNRTTMIDSIGLYTFAYDPRDLLTGRTDYGLSQAITYDSAQQRSTLTDPDGGVRTYFWDPDSRLENYVNVAGLTTTFQYDPADRGRVAGTRFGPISTF